EGLIVMPSGIVTTAFFNGGGARPSAFSSVGKRISTSRPVGDSGKKVVGAISISGSKVSLSQPSTGGAKASKRLKTPGFCHESILRTVTGDCPVHSEGFDRNRIEGAVLGVGMQKKSGLPQRSASWLESAGCPQRVTAAA